MLDKIKNSLVVSCQALETEPLYGEGVMAKMAVAAKLGGAVGIRSNSVSDINSIYEATKLPIIGIIKRDYSDSEIYITATTKEVLELADSKCEMIATDATSRVRPNSESLELIVETIHKCGKLAMADISTYEEAVTAQELGFDCVSTTLSGYTDYSPKIDGPDLSLIEKCVNNLKIPVIAEGKINTTSDLEKVLMYNVHSVVVGSAITRPLLITKRFAEVFKN